MKYLTGRIYADTLRQQTSSSGKAFYVTLRNDHMFSGPNEARFWIPKSQCEISEPNECGCCDILVPLWIFVRNQVKEDRVREISWQTPGIVVK